MLQYPNNRAPPPPIYFKTNPYIGKKPGKFWTPSRLRSRISQGISIVKRYHSMYLYSRPFCPGHYWSSWSSWRKYARVRTWPQDFNVMQWQRISWQEITSTFLNRNHKKLETKPLQTTNCSCKLWQLTSSIQRKYNIRRGTYDGACLYPGAPRYASSYAA